MSAALHLPAPLYEQSKNIPIYVHLWEQGDAITKANATGQFGHIYCFGTGTSADKDPLFKERLELGQRVNFVYSTLYSSEENPPAGVAQEWYRIIESNKFSSIYSANSIPIKMRSFGKSVSSADNVALCETEHRRWVLAELLLGFKPLTKTELAEIKKAVAKDIQDYNKEHSVTNGTKDNSPSWKTAWDSRKTTFRHVDIVSFDDLIDEKEQEKDVALMVNVPFILGENKTILKPID